MAVLSTRQGLKDYCLRRLGYPVIDINVDAEQVEDRIDDALQKYRDFHFDGTEHVYYKHVLTTTDITNKYITVPEALIGITRIFRISSSSNVTNLFNIRYQIHLNDLFDYTASTYVPYVTAMRHVESLEEIFVGDKPIRFNRHKDILYIDMDWSTDVSSGNYLILDGYNTIDPEVYTDVYNDGWLKKYTTSLIKRQWGENLKKFEGMQLPGGITFNGQKIWEEAESEIIKMEEELINSYSLPVMDMMN